MRGKKGTGARRTYAKRTKTTPLAAEAAPAIVAAPQRITSDRPGLLEDAIGRVIERGLAERQAHSTRGGSIYENGLTLTVETHGRRFFVDIRDEEDEIV